jgi:hypothetical protein
MEDAKDLFNKALEIEPENGFAFWGLYLIDKKCDSFEEVLKRAPSMQWLEDDNSFLDRARRYSDRELHDMIRRLDDVWMQSDKSGSLPVEMQQDFVNREGILRKKKDGTSLIQNAVIPSGVIEIAPNTFLAAQD